MPRRPNILWIQCDELRADALGCYANRYDVHLTPNLDHLAERGVRFTDIHVNSPVCVSSRTSMLVGKYPHEIGVYHNEAVNTHVLPHGTLTFPEVLARAGYRTVNVGKIHTPRHDTWSEILRTGPRARLQDVKIENAIHSPGPPNVYFAGVWPDDVPTYSTLLADKAVQWLTAVPSDRPWLLRVSFVDPHTPVLPPARFAKMANKADFACDPSRDTACETMSLFEQELSRVQRSDDLTPEQVVRCRTRYFALMAHVDYEAGRILDTLKAKGMEKDTIVYFDADHGAMLGENGLWQKQSFQSIVTRSPYLISWPGALPEGEVRKDLGNLLDTGPTLLGLCGIPCKSSAAPDRCHAQTRLSVSSPEEHAQASLGRGTLPDEGRRGRDLFADSPDPDAVYGIIGYGNEDSITYPLAKSGEVWPRRACIRTKTHRLDVSVRFRGRALSGDERQPCLIDLAKDPDERTNVYHDPLYRDVRDRLESDLNRWLEMSIEVDLGQ